MKARGNNIGTLGWGRHHELLALGSFVILPYSSVIGLIGFFFMTLGWLINYPKEIWQRLCQQGWGWLTLALGLSVALAEDPTRAALKSTNFWPFFLFFAGLSIYATRLPKPLHSLERWAFWLLLASIPINLRAMVEYGFRAPSMAARFGEAPWMAWLYQTTNYGHRADSVFGHPNVLAAYLVMIFGLGLGLCLRTLSSSPAGEATVPLLPASASRPQRFFLPRRFPTTAWIYGATALIPLGVFSSGSRSGILIILVQLLIAMALIRRHRWAFWAGLGITAATLIGVIYGGIGGRSLTEALRSSTLRVDIWQMSLPLIRQHPWFGVGLGGFQNYYEPYSIANEPMLYHLHNLWLHLTAEAGLPVMVLLTGLVGRVCYRAVRSYQFGLLPVSAQPILVGYGLGFLAGILFSIFDIAFFDARINLLGWTMLAALQSISDLADESRY